MIGYFTNTGNEYVITKPDLKRPMLNYFWNKKILIGVNHQGGGKGGHRGNCSSFIGFPEKPRAQLIKDGNRYFYIKDEKTGALWNPGWYPTKTSIQNYECVHGLGYSRITAEKDGIRVSVCGCAAGDFPAELWEISVQNLENEPRKIKVYPFVDFSLEGYVHASEYDSWVRGYFYEDHNLIFAENNAEERPHAWHHGFCATSIAASSFETSKRCFLGEYGFIPNPKSLEGDVLTDSLASCEEMVGVLENELTLQSQESITYYFTVGFADSPECAKAICDEVFADGYYANNMKSIAEETERLCSGVMFDSPDKKVNDMVNYWLKKQVQLCAEVGRGTGKGFRDQLQDAWAITAFNPANAKGKIYEALENIHQSGVCNRGWNPLKARDMSDSSTWVAPTINAYLKETRDFAFLKKAVKYYDGGEDTVWDHILTTTRHSSDDIGPHGLVLARQGDWNDSLNHLCEEGRGESVWSSMALYSACLNVAEMASTIQNDDAVAKEMRERAERIKTAIEAYAWDGEWYLAGYNDKGERVGSYLEEEGMIYLNPQTWSVITGVASEERARLCIQSVDRYLNSDYGPLTLYPPYTKYNPNIGRLTGFVPGVWENGAPYCHGGAFKVVCDCMLGRGDEAFASVMDILPDSNKNPSTHSGCEPYALTNMYLGPDNRRRGETSSAWITGAAGWIYRALTQYMLGFHPGYDTVTFDPCLPSHWKYLNGTRVFRGATYVLKINNPRGNTKGIKRITVNGQETERTIPCFTDNGIHNVVIDL